MCCGLAALCHVIHMHGDALWAQALCPKGALGHCTCSLCISSVQVAVTLHSKSLLNLYLLTPLPPHAILPKPINLSRPSPPTPLQQDGAHACRANMDVLVSLGTNASYLYSMISILHHHIMRHHITGLYRPTDFFETSAMLITFILLGKYLEAAAKSRTSAAITRLLQLTPPTATLLTLDAKGNVAAEQELPTSLVHRGDLLKVQLGTV